MHPRSHRGRILGQPDDVPRVDAAAGGGVEVIDTVAKRCTLAGANLGLLEGEVTVTSDCLCFEGRSVRDVDEEGSASARRLQSSGMITTVIVPLGKIDCRSRGPDGVAE